MKLFRALTAAFCLALPAAAACAQTTFADPANLRGERIRPRDGRELAIDQGASGLQQLLRKLSTRASILNIVAHPDDEDGGMLTFYARGLGARVADLALTRGEGGQNAMTADFEDALGLLRTQELLANDRYTGVDQMFGTEVDFGFSKTKEEAFGKWTHERCLYDAVRAIRLYRPLVITATFIGGVTDGHGQHQVSGQIAQEAFKAAGDPAVFPDMIAEGILPWQPLKVYARVPAQSITPQGLYDYATGQYTPARFTNYVTGETSTTPPSTDVVVHEGIPDPLLADESGKPRSYIQFARIGLGQQKSQIGPGFRTAPAGVFDVPYHLYGTAICGSPVSIKNCHSERNGGPVSGAATTSRGTFFDGIDTSLLGIQDLDPVDFPTDLLSVVQRAVQSANETLDVNHPGTAAPLLAIALQNTDLLMAEVLKSQRGPRLARESALHELRVKRVQLNDALVLALGLSLEATVEGSASSNAAPGSTVKVLSRIDNGALGVGINLQGILAPTIHSFSHTFQLSNTPATPNTVTTLSDTLELRPDAPFTRPYFSRPSIEQPRYDLLDPALRNAPQGPPPMVAYARFVYEHLSLELRSVVSSSSKLPSGTAFRQPVSIVPIASVSFSRSAGILPLADSSSLVWAESRIPLSPCVDRSGDTPDCMRFRDQSVIRLNLPQKWTSAEAPSNVLSPGASTLTQYDGFTLNYPPLTSGESLSATAVATYNGREYTEGYRTVGYPGLVATNYFKAATYRAGATDLKLPKIHFIGYIAGTGDEVLESLFPLFGGHVVDIEVKDINPETLKRYDVVVLGVRTYSAHPELHGPATHALLDYARNGGNVVVQYQTAEFTAADAPYPLTLGYDAEKIIDETAPVRLLEPANPLLTTPNRITPADFDGWVNERGHGILRTWDLRYTALTETHDPGSTSEAVRPQEPQRGALITTPLGKGRWTYCAFALYRQLPEGNPGAFRLFLNLIQP